ncbi:threonine synthase [Elioraea thermophila]|uniref:threonine synthase n=1 Tax=Elioraea thermophila TaxID=2185104 RepID=UPI0018E4E485|nr:pyridoxal-phosphate dependent enzyme [Elioraea thermophila]
MSSPAYLDPRTGRTFPLERPRWRSDDGNPLMITPLPGIGRDDIELDLRSLWRYRAAFPFGPEVAPITLGEGCSPLIKVRLDGAGVLAKLEWFSPTGSFKDRGASVMLSGLRAQGITEVLEDSSGNGGAAIAAYAAAGGMRAKILVPAATSPAKTVQMEACGAEVERVSGTRQDCADEAVRQAERIFYASHNWHPFFLQGTKTLAYELWEDLGFRVPEAVIAPCGAGSIVLGLEIGFGELLRAGAIERIPRLFAVQPEACAPIAAAFRAGVDHPVACEIRPTIAEGTAIARPLRLREVLGAVRATEGGVIAVAEAEIVAAFHALAERGLFVEPTCASALAGWRKLRAAGTLAEREETVLILTGTGLKAVPRIAELIGARS